MPTISAPSALLGRREPRLRSVPPYVSSAGEEAIEFAASVGLTLDPWQRLVMTDALGEVPDVDLRGRPSMRWAAYEVDVTVGRQNGKGTILEARELAGVELFGEKLIIHTAHEMKTTEEARLRMEQICEASPDLDRRVKRVVRANGKEGIEFWDDRRSGVGARIKYTARSKGSGRGFAGADLVVMDEKMFLRSEPMAALLPTLATSPNPQVWYTGSAHFPESSQQLALRGRMLAGGDRSLAAFEWSVPDGGDLLDRESWAAANPGLGHRFGERFLVDEHAALEEADFAREHLGIGGGGARAVVVDMGVWGLLADKTPPPLSDVVFAVDVTPDRSRASLAVAASRPDGRRHVEVARNERGAGWVVAATVESLSRWPGATVVLDASGPAGSLIADLSAAGVEPYVTSSREMGQACGSFFDAVAAGRLSHFDQPALNSALGAARKRPLGDAWAWHRKDPSTDISPLVAVTLALFGLDRPRPETPRRSGRVW